MGHDPPQRRKRTVISFRDVMISGPFSQSEDGELQIEGVLEGDLTCHALIVPPGGTVKGTIRADWVVIQGNFCGNVETSVFTATKDAVVIGGRITVYEKVLIEPECLFRGELQRPGEGDASPARGFARSAAVAESDRLAAETMASWSFTEGDTALVEAVVKGDSKIAGRLLLAGADPNAAAPEGMTALTLAAANLRVEIAELLLGAGADPDLRTAEDETPLLLACDRGAQRLVEVLLAGDLDPQVGGRLGQGCHAFRRRGVGVGAGQQQAAGDLGVALDDGLDQGCVAFGEAPGCHGLGGQAVGLLGGGGACEAARRAVVALDGALQLAAEQALGLDQDFLVGGDPAADDHGLLGRREDAGLDVAAEVALIVPPGGTVKGTIRADWVVIQGNFCGNVETSVFTATKDAVVIGGRITV